MMKRRPGLYRLLALTLLSIAPVVLARVGSGEHYDSGRSGGSGGGGDIGDLIGILVWLVIEVPYVGVPVAVIAVGVFVWQRRTQGTRSTRVALDRMEEARRTTVSAEAVSTWVAALKASDPHFELLGFLDRVKGIFLEVQEAWFRRDLTPVRRFLSDATFQRLSAQLQLIALTGKRDAVADPQVLDLSLIGLSRSEHYDSVHVRVTATIRDTDAPAMASDGEALALARARPPERFVEVWTLVRKPGTATRPDAAPGACPSCGAPFTGGASGQCEYCQAIVNSGSYDWVVAEITQGSEHVGSLEAPEGLARARQGDPGLAVEVLEDKASLMFWKWVEAHGLAQPRRLAKLSSADFLGRVAEDIEAREARGARQVLHDCAVGAVNTRQLSNDGAMDVAAVEIRWSARVPVPGADQLVSQPQRSVLLLERRAGARSPAATGMSTNRCPSCAAPLSDNGQTVCEYCGTALASGAMDWVVRDLMPWERWVARFSGAARARPVPVGARVPDREERERLVYVMAGMAMADGAVSAKERELLRSAADRWGVPWANVELALTAGPKLYGTLLGKGSVEAEAFMKSLVEVALVDGKVDPTERKLLSQAALHLGLSARLDEFLARR